MPPKKGAIVSQKSLVKTPFKPDRVSSSHTPNHRGPRNSWNSWQPCWLSAPLNRGECYSISDSVSRLLGSAIGRTYLASTHTHTPVGVLDHLALNYLGSSTARLWCTKQNCNRGLNSQPRPRPRLNSQPQGATKAQSVLAALRKREDFLESSINT